MYTTLSSTILLAHHYVVLYFFINSSISLFVISTTLNHWSDLLAVAISWCSMSARNSDFSTSRTKTIPSKLPTGRAGFYSARKSSAFGVPCKLSILLCISSSDAHDMSARESRILDYENSTASSLPYARIHCIVAP